MQFDLISDLHIEEWGPDQQIEWSGLGTSLIAVIAGDVSRNLQTSYKTVLEISKHYKHVVFVDGNHEHADMPGIEARSSLISDLFEKYRNISYLHRNVVVLDSVAFIGCNGWSSFDFCEPFASRQECFETLSHYGKMESVLMEQWQAARDDAEHMGNLVEACSRDSGIKSIVLVTHTVPHRDLVWLAPGENPVLAGGQGSSYLERMQFRDVNAKIRTWAFGHQHRINDLSINAIRYVSNPRGSPRHAGAQKIYYPRCIKH